MGALFNEILYRPLLNALVILYQYLTFYDLGLAIILLTVLIRLILFPIFHKSTKHQLLTQALQPKIKEIQQNHKDNREAQAKAILDLYSRNKLNPFTPFLLLLVQLPILIALYQVFIGGFSDKALASLYSFVPAPETINYLFLNIIDLQNPNIILVFLAALAQYFQARLAMKKVSSQKTLSGPAERMQKNMVYVGPIIALLILWNFPAALGLYWLISTLFSVLQQVIVNKNLKVEEIK